MTNDTASRSFDTVDEDRLSKRGKNADAARAHLALQAGHMGCWSHHVLEDEVWGDQIVADLLDFDFHAQPWSFDDFLSALHPEDVARVADAVDKAYSGVAPFYDVELRRIPPNDNMDPAAEQWIGSRAQVTHRDEDGKALRVIGVNWDITAVKQNELKLARLAAEMDHRVKNAFAVIRALINIGASTATNTAEFADTLRAQVEAMASAHTVSAQMARSEKEVSARVALKDVIETALEPWSNDAAAPNTQIRVECDPSILLPPAEVAAFAMLLYELTTNATKYGPLGEAVGSLSVTADRTDGGGTSLRWLEKHEVNMPATGPGGPAKGFGEVLLKHCANNLNGTFTRELTADSFRFQLTIKGPVQS